MKTRFALITGLLCLPFCGIAQQAINGSVVGIDQEPLPHTTIWLLTGDSSLVATAYTDTLGRFSLPLPASGKSYLLKLQRTGYEPVCVPARGDAPAAPGPLMMLPAAQMLEDVAIRGRKSLIERKPDRVIFNVQNSAATDGSDAWELLKRAPGVQVSHSEIHMAGKSSVSVMINDRLVQLEGSELESMLRGMPAGTIARIEVITTPPAKYDADGNSGILHIVTKKNTADGFNGNITLSYEQRTRGAQNLQSNINYRKGRLNLYGTFNANRFRFISTQENTTRYPAQRQEQVLNQDNRPFYTWSQAGVDYYLNDKEVLGVLYTHGTMHTHRDEQIRTRVLRLPGQTTDSLISTDAFAKDIGQRDVVNLNYERKLDTLGSKLVVNGDYFYRTGEKRRDFTTGNFFEDLRPTGLFSDNRTSGSQLTRIASARADLEWITPVAELSGGVKASFIRNKADNLFAYLSAAGYLTDEGKSNVFDYREHTQALYLSARKSLGSWKAQAGLRAEYTQTEGRSLTLDQTNKNAYFQWFPTAYIQYRPGETHSWNLNYTRRINRPSFWNMNPFRVYSTATAYEQGNPFLQPSFSHNLELGYTYRSLLSLTLFAQKVAGTAIRVSHIDTLNRTFYFSQANAGNELQYGFSLALNFSPLPWWEASGQLYGTVNRFRSAYYGTGISYSRPSLAFETSHTFLLNKAQTLTAELNFSYTTRQQSDFDLQRSTANLEAGFKAQLLQKRLLLSLYMEDIFRTDIWQVEHQYNGTFQYSYFDNRCLRIALGWKFGNRALREKRRRDTSIEDAGRSN